MLRDGLVQVTAQHTSSCFTAHTRSCCVKQLLAAALLQSVNQAQNRHLNIPIPKEGIISLHSLSPHTHFSYAGD